MKYKYILIILSILAFAGVVIAEIMPDGVTECHFEDFVFVCSDNNVYGTWDQAMQAHPSPIPSPIPTPNQIIVDVSPDPTQLVVGSETLIITSRETTTLTIWY